MKEILECPENTSITELSQKIQDEISENDSPERIDDIGFWLLSMKK